MLPQKEILKKEIKSIIDSNPYSADNPEDGKRAVDYFCDKMAEMLLKTIKSSTVILKPGSIKTTVTTSTGAGTGINNLPVKGELK